jgi:hypothetical protein
MAIQEVLGGLAMPEPIYIDDRRISKPGMKGRCVGETRLLVTSEPFEIFLCWLSPDRDAAGKKYEQIRTKMVSFFSWRGCHIPEDLFDRTIDRVCRKIEIGSAECSGDALAYCYAVGRFVLQEYWREVKVSPLPDDLQFLKRTDPERKEEELQCLEICLGRLSQHDRYLITRYYQGEGRERIRIRQQLAAQVGGINALRIHVFKIRARLRGWVSEVDGIQRKAPCADQA